MIEIYQRFAEHENRDHCYSPIMCVSSSNPTSMIFLVIYIVLLLHSASLCINQIRLFFISFVFYYWLRKSIPLWDLNTIYYERFVVVSDVGFRLYGKLRWNRKRAFCSSKPYAHVFSGGTKLLKLAKHQWLHTTPQITVFTLIRKCMRIVCFACVLKLIEQKTTTFCCPFRFVGIFHSNGTLGFMQAVFVFHLLNKNIHHWILGWNWIKTL